MVKKTSKPVKAAKPKKSTGSFIPTERNPTISKSWKDQPLPKCPDCDVQVRNIIHGGAYGICKNAKCDMSLFPNMNFKAIGDDNGTRNKSYNNSGRAKF